MAKTFVILIVKINTMSGKAAKQVSPKEKITKFAKYEDYLQFSISFFIISPKDVHRALRHLHSTKLHDVNAKQLTNSTLGKCLLPKFDAVQKILTPNLKAYLSNQIIRLNNDLMTLKVLRL